MYVRPINYLQVCGKKAQEESEQAGVAAHEEQSVNDNVAACEDVETVDVEVEEYDVARYVLNCLWGEVTPIWRRSDLFVDYYHIYIIILLYFTVIVSDCCSNHFVN